MEFDKAMAVLAALDRFNVAYVLVGGFALGLHGLIRATEDIDLFVRPEKDNIERLKDALRSVWDDPSIEDILAEDLLGEYPAVRYGPPEGPALDIIARLGEEIRFESLSAETVEIEGVRVRLATPATLYQMKRDTVRPIDRQDARALNERFDLDDPAEGHDEEEG